jgi:hypothetical protein
MSHDASSDMKNDAKDLVAGIVDGALRLDFIKTKAGIPRLRVRVVSSNEAAILHVRGWWPSRVFTVRAKKSGGVLAIADFDGPSARAALRYVSSRGVVHRRAAEIALGMLKGVESGELSEKGFEKARAELEKELAAAAKTVERTREVRKVGRKRKAGEDVPAPDAVPTADQPPVEKKFVTETVPTAEEVSSIVDAAAARRKWIEGFVSSSGVSRDAEDIGDDKRKTGRVVIVTNKMPRGLAVAAAVRELAGAGKLGLARPRVAFTSKKDLAKLREAFGNDRSGLVNFDALV